MSFLLLCYSRVEDAGIQEFDKPIEGVLSTGQDVQDGEEAMHLTLESAMDHLHAGPPQRVAESLTLVPERVVLGRDQGGGGGSRRDRCCGAG